MAPVNIRCKKLFRFCLWGSCSNVKKRRSTYLGLSSCETHYPYFRTISMALRRFEIACWVTPKVSASFYSVWYESWCNNASNSASSNFTSLPSRSLSLVSTSPLLKFRDQYLHVFIDVACSPYASHNKRCSSAALFFKLKQKSSASRKCCFVGTKVDMDRAQKRRVVTSAKWYILAIRGKCWRFNINIVTRLTDAI